MAAAEDYHTQLPPISYRNQAFIAGKFVPAASGKTFDCISPIDGKVLTKVADMRQGRCRPRGQGGARGVRKRRVVGDGADGPQENHAQMGGAGR